ncbi:tetratricopeptide repeat protein [Rhodocista pekingensis]|uniref:Tetratricopeptide repeat protein n=1 Tax=Rhodocista pekingensis TaxID=201185 RepID=A0ABW2KPF2_9PROT
MRRPPLHERLTTLASVLALLAGTEAFAQPARPEAQPPAQQAPATAPAAVPRVAVRAGIHPGYTRLVFDWPSDVGYRVERDGTQVMLRFDRAARADFAQARRINPPRVQGLTQVSDTPGLAVRFTVAADATLKDFRSGARVVVDIAGPSPAAAAPAVAETPPAAAPPATPPATTPPADQPAGARPAREAPKPAPSAAAPAARPRGMEARMEEERRKAEGEPLWQLSQQRAAAQAGTPAGTPPAGGQPAPTQPVPSQPAPAQPVPAQPAPAPAGAPPATPPAPAPPSPAEPVAAVEAAPVIVAFDPQAPTAAAVFERAGWLYILFDRPVPPAAAPAAVPGLTGAIEPVTHADGGGFRFTHPVILTPRVEKEGTVWRVVLARPEAQPAPGDGIPVDAEPDFALGPRLVLKTPDAARVIDFTDPVVGDTLKVVPLPLAGQNMPEPLRLADAQILSSAQGIVVRPVNDQLLVQPVREGVEITIPGGLRLSPPEDIAAALPPPPAEPERLYDYAAWGQVPPQNYIRRRQALWQEVVAAPPGNRGRERLKLARFYLANGWGAEALGLLDLILEEQPDLDRRAEFLAVRGAARALAGDPDGAIADLSSRSLVGEPDADLWQAAAHAEKGEWDRAATLFARQARLLRDYPEPFFSRLALLAADAALRQGDLDTAGRLIDRLDRRGADDGPRAAAFHYFAGELAHKQGDERKAEDAWEKAAASNDRLYRTRATKDLIDLRLANGKLPPEKAAEEMEKLRFAWRGDDLELEIQRRLGEVHALAKQYPAAFDTLKRAITLYPDSPQAAEIAKRMSEIFANLFVQDGAASMPPLEALALYEQYRELTPPGPDGDLVIRRLAERLVEIDLLDRAAELLEHQVQYRLAGTEKAQVGTRAAGIRLLDSKPDKALATLDASEMPDLPAALVEERRLLRARALADLGRGSEAVGLLAADGSRPAKLLRIDVAWRDKQWPAAAAALADLIGPPPAAGTELAPEQSRLVINRAVALALAQDDAGLRQIRDQFGPAMEKTADATAFRVLTRPDEAAGLVDAATIRSRIAEIDMFRSFLDGYRTRQQAATPPAADTPPAPAGMN